MLVDGNGHNVPNNDINKINSIIKKNGFDVILSREKIIAVKDDSEILKVTKGKTRFKIYSNNKLIGKDIYPFKFLSGLLSSNKIKPIKLKRNDFNIKLFVKNMVNDLSLDEMLLNYNESKNKFIINYDNGLFYLELSYNKIENTFYYTYNLALNVINIEKLDKKAIDIILYVNDYIKLLRKKGIL